MTQRMLTSALIAGFAAGLLVALLQFFFVEKLILLAEEYENGTRVHFAGVAEHDHATADVAAEAESHDHEAPAGEPSPLVRHGMTVLFAGLTYSGFALMMVAGFSAAGSLGHRPDLKAGLLWGLSGFAAFQLAPAVGLEPELPGTIAADLAARQIWWVGCVVATASGLALMAFGRGIMMRAAGMAVLVLPHLVGAPELDGFSGIAPPELAAQFAARSLAVGLCGWLTLGAVASHLWGAKEA